MPKKPRLVVEFFPTENPPISCPSIAGHYWRCAEQLLNEAASADQRFNALVLSVICLYHSVLECYINETLGLSMVKGGEDKILAAKCRDLQDETLSEKKLRRFVEAYGFTSKFAPSILERAATFARFRNKLHHHSPEMRPLNLYPAEAAAVFQAAGVEAINTGWIYQSMSIKVGRWCRDTVRQFIDEFCRCADKPSDLLDWRPIRN